MITRAFAGQPAHLTFTKDFREFLHGDLAPGATVTLYYDAERMPQTRPYVNGVPAWSISCHAKFHEDGAALEYPLRSETGIILTKSGDEPGSGTMLTGEIAIPADAGEFVLWFVNTGGSGSVYYDSDFGKNYGFPFLVCDVRVAAGQVVPDPAGAHSQFSAEIHAAPEVANVVLDYRVTNRGPVAPEPTRVALTPTDATDDGWQIWSTGSINVPFAAVVSYSVTYTRGNRTYFDDNDHRGYLASQPAADAPEGQ